MASTGVLKRVRNNMLVLLGVILVSGIFFYGFSQGLIFYIDSMVSPVNEDSEYPTEAFERPYPGEKEGSSVDWQVKNLKGSSFEKRMKIGRIAIRDFGTSGKYVLKALQGKGTVSKRKGRIHVSSCVLDSFQTSHEACKRETRYPGGFTLIYKGWLKGATQTGSLEKLYVNDTAREVLNRYTERSTYYDSYLNPNGFEMKPLEAVYYTDNSGLHIIGSGEEELYIDGEKVNTDRNGNWAVADVKLDSGYHELRRGNFSLQMPVYGFIPEWSVTEQKLKIASTPIARDNFFDSVHLLGLEDSIEVELDKGRQEVSIPDKPQALKFVKENFSVKFDANFESNSEMPMNGEVFGMTEKEYKRFERISNFLGKDLSPGF